MDCSVLLSLLPKINYVRSSDWLLNVFSNQQQGRYDKWCFKRVLFHWFFFPGHAGIRGPVPPGHGAPGMRPHLGPGGGHPGMRVPAPGGPPSLQPRPGQPGGGPLSLGPPPPPGKLSLFIIFCIMSDSGMTRMTPTLISMDNVFLFLRWFYNHFYSPST